MSKLQKPQQPTPEGLPVRLVLCLDGTGDTAEGSFNAVDGKKSGTKDSIVTIYELAKAGIVSDLNGKEFFQRVEYFEGVGTVGNEKADARVKFIAGVDGATGHGYLDILREAYRVCCRELQPSRGQEHELFIFGFSRGAFISRALASFLQYVGIIKKEYLGKESFTKKFHELLARYDALTRKPITRWWTKTAKPETALAAKLSDFCWPSSRVRLLGAFDTVKTVVSAPRLPGLRNTEGSSANVDFQMDAPGIVDRFRHALALNEQRFLFNPDLWHLAARSADCSYLEAWFFGFHHDIGGGDSVQGLALWPLQWILHEAMEAGLVLDSTVHPYEVLFTRHEEPKLMETPHNVLMKMFDMIIHHQSDKVYGLKLNQPHSFTFPVPRKYTKYLTQPPYSKFLRPKVFVHPSAYLVFDISTEFRLQLYQWEYFQTFLSGRFDSLPRDKAPWWEEQTIRSILNENVAADHLNILVIGRRHTRKEDVVGRIFGPLDIPGRTSIDTPVTIRGNNKVRIYFSHGFSERDSSDSQQSVENFLRKRRDDTNPNSRIHALWYFLDCTEDVVQPSEKKFFKMDFGEIPVLVVLANEDKLFSRIVEKAADMKDLTLDMKSAKKAIDAAKSMTKAIGDLVTNIKKLTAQMEGFPVKKYVHTKNPSEAAKNLLSETSVLLPDQATQLIGIKAQRLQVKPKIALATEESIRAYIMWYMHKEHGHSSRFSRNHHLNEARLTNMLLEPILSTFNIRFDGDANLIIAEIGDPWRKLDSYRNGLCDARVPGLLIILCTIDAILVMTHAITHKHDDDEREEEKQIAVALTEADIKQACQWYRGSKQAETHAMIRGILKADGKPKDNSIAAFQMRVIEIVELRSTRARKTSPILTKLKDALGSVTGTELLQYVVTIGAVGIAIYAARAIRTRILPQSQYWGAVGAICATGILLGVKLGLVAKRRVTATA